MNCEHHWKIFIQYKNGYLNVGINDTITMYDFSQSSYKSWICSNHHELFCINSTSRSWDKQMPCSSFCHQTQAMCPFLRIGDKAKILGSTPVFLCEGTRMPIYLLYLVRTCGSTYSNTTVKGGHSVV